LCAVQRVVLSVQIINVGSLDHLLHLGVGNVTGWGVVVVHDMLEGEGAFVVVELIKETLRNHVEVVEGVRQGLLGLVPASASVSNHHSVQVDVVQSRVECGLQVVLVDLPGQVGDVDSGVTFTTDKELVSFEFREFSVPGLDGVEGVHRLDHIVSLHVLGSSSEGEADTSGTLEPDDVGLHVPGEGVVLDLCLTIVNNPRSILLHETKHR